MTSSAATTVRVHLPPSLHNHVDAHDGEGEVDGGSSELRPSDESPSRHWPSSPSLSESFAADGFVVIRNVLDGETVRALNERLRAVLDGTYDRGKPPDKCPRPAPGTAESRDGKDPRERRGRDDCDGASNAAKTGAEGGVAERIENSNSGRSRSSGDGNLETATRNESSSNRSRRGKKEKGVAKGGGTHNGNQHNKVRVVQVINVHKSDSLFRSLAVSPELGRVVSHLAGWSSRQHGGGGGTRLAQDQVWAKPPGSPPLTYHRDSPYFMFSPDDVVTVWVALDDMDEELGPLEYVRGSHRWTVGGGGRVVSDDDSKTTKSRGSASRFFPADRGVSMLRRAAEAAGDRPIDLVSMSKLRAGDISIHHGKTWHGSGPNLSKARWRRGLGLHYVPRDVRFTEEAVHSSLWRKYVVGHNGVGDVREIELDEEDFPVVWNS